MYKVNELSAMRHVYVPQRHGALFCRRAKGIAQGRQRVGKAYTTSLDKLSHSSVHLGGRLGRHAFQVRRPAVILLVNGKVPWH